MPGGPPQQTKLPQQTVPGPQPPLPADRQQAPPLQIRLGAHTLPQEPQLVGSLEVGKQADLVIMDVSDYREIPYWYGANHCQMTVLNGVIAANG